MIYVAFAIAQFMMIAVASHLLSLAIIKTTASMHSQAFNHVIHAPLSFYDTTPIGRILNRYFISHHLFIVARMAKKNPC